MVFKNSLFLGCLMLFVSPFADASVIFWRVSSDVTQTVAVPDYQKQKNPFPIRIRPVQIKQERRSAPVETKKTLTENQRRSMLASEVLTDIRELLEEEDIFNPDISGAVVSALVKGTNGNIALIRNTWMGEGDAMEVPVMAKERLFELLDLLKTLDRSLHLIVEKEVDERLASAGDLSLKILRIHDTHVELEDGQGGVHVMHFQ